MSSTNFRFIDLFAGIGGIRQGFESIGGKCVFSSEWDKYAQISYQANYGETPSGDLTQIKEEDIPLFDVLCGGFPCQPFSMAGHKKGFEDTRGTLFFEIARLLKYHQPKAVFLENVKNFLSHDKGKTFLVVKRTLEELGYTVYYKVLNAKDFGVPQNRERIFIVAFLGNVPFSFPSSPYLGLLFPSLKAPKLGDILETNVNPKYTISDRLWAGHQRRKAEHKRKGNGFGYSLFREESPYTSTLSARYYKDGSEILIDQKEKNPRKLTPRECARLQGFPESFCIVVSDVQAYKQFGNSVAVPVIKALASSMEAPLLQLLNKKQERNYG